MTSDRVILSWPDMFRAGWVGVKRGIKARRDKRTPHFAKADDVKPWDATIEGAFAECAFSRLAGCRWVASTDPDTLIGDVAGYGVRSTSHEDGHLILYPKDPPEQWFVLMVGSGCEWRCAGMIQAREVFTAPEATRRRWWRAGARKPSYWVPQSALVPFERKRAVA